MKQELKSVRQEDQGRVSPKKEGNREEVPWLFQVGVMREVCRDAQ